MQGDPAPSSLLSFQMLAGAAERLRRKRPQDGSEDEWLARVEDARDRLSRMPFVPEPLDAFVDRGGGRERVVASARPPDRLIEEALRPLVEKAVEPILSGQVHAYRRGRSTFTAALAASDALRAGRHELLLLDVSAFYESVDRGRLRTRLEQLLPVALVEVIVAMMSAPLILGGSRVEREKGIPPGRSLSPLLANLYLCPLDEAAGRFDVVYLRYGDDLLIASRDPAEVDACGQALAVAAEGLGLALSEAKRRRFRFDGEPFPYLGHLLDGNGVYERLHGTRLEKLAGAGRKSPGDLLGGEDGDGTAADHPHERARTLYVTESGLYLKARDGLVAILRGKEVVREIPLHRVDRVLILAGVAMTSGFLTACVIRGIPVVFFAGRGRAYGALVAGGIPNPLRLQSQYRLTADAERRMALGREIVRGKLDAMLRRLARVQAAAEARGRVARLVPSIAEAPSPVVLRGVEGAASRAYYEGFAARVRAPGFEFRKRSRRPPRDPVNSLLSFAYSLLFGEMQTALLARGLDPHPGLLHDLARNHPALASDLIEPYRILIADSFVLTLVNNRRVEVSGFETRGEAVLMNDSTRKTVLGEYERFMESPAGGPQGGGAPRRLVESAAGRMLRVVLGESERLDLPLGAGDVREQQEVEDPE